MYLMLRIRPDLAFSVMFSSGFLRIPLLKVLEVSTTAMVSTVEAEAVAANEVFNFNLFTMCRLLLGMLLLNKFILIKNIEISKTSSDFNLCISNVVKRNFKRDTTLQFINYVDTDVGMLEDIATPHVLVNLENKVLLDFNFISDFVISAKNGRSLSKILAQLKRSKVWHKSTSLKKKFLIILHSTNITNVFETLWSNGIIDVLLMILANNFTKGFTVCTSNPFDDGNQCGNKSLVKFCQPCSEDIRSPIKIPLPQLNGCQITISHWSNETLFSNNPFSEVINFFLTKLSQSLNATVTKFLSYRNFVERFRKYEIVFDIGLTSQYAGFESSKTFYRQDWVWITPAPIRIFPINTIALLFCYEVWILIILIFAMVVIVWWKISILENRSNLSLVFINIASLTFSGTISVIPKLKILRYIFYIYSLYALTIQTAFKANLIQVLTFPRYSGRIGSVNDIITLNIPIYIQKHYSNSILLTNNDDSKSFTEFKTLIIDCEDYNVCIDETYYFRNSACSFVNRDRLSDSETL
ncbi:hypothetical protein FQR65_LT17582 [Abscondita terminalis]|nr:hypothetical protein FQR65_LT17582 [Abscondita terminalis]